MIRPFRPSDVKELCLFGDKFVKEIGSGEFDAKSFLQTLSRIINENKGKVFVLEIDGAVAGSIGLVAYPCFYNYKHVRVQEMFWWVDHQYRNTRESIKLFNKAEEWATEIGATQLMVSSSLENNADKLEKFYSKKGFRKIDINYVKDLKNA